MKAQAENSSTAPRIRFAEITKSFAGTPALNAVSFDVLRGSVHALVGENGAGKSTLMKILAGAVPMDGGRLELDGRLVQIDSPRTAQELGIAIVYQELNLAPHLTVAENIFLGRWPHSSLSGLLHFDDLFNRTTQLLTELGMKVPVSAPVESLSIAHQQMVEIAKAISLRANILILDEPSAVLSPSELTNLFHVIRAMAARGVSILYISHRLDEIFDLANHVTVLRDGRHISTRPIQDVRRDQLIQETVGRPIEQEYPRRDVSLGDVRLSVEVLSVPGRFGQVSFEIQSGEVFALTGMVGSGRSSVGQAIFGANRPVHGQIRVGDQHGPFENPRAAKAAGVGFVPEDRKQQGLLLERSVSENITLAHRDAISSIGFIRSARENETVAAMMQGLDIRAAGPKALASSLSGGNQQKALLARWIQRPYPVMILDEPTRGVDVGAKVEIYGIINKLASQGTAVLMISSELPETIGMADRIGVMCRGKLAGILDNRRRDVTQDAIMRMAVGEASQ